VSLSQLAPWQELPEMAMEQGKYRLIYQFVAQYQRLAATNRAHAAAGKNIKTAAAESRKF
jgi:hypothetical protein